jgi:hypothetical protein
METKWEQAITQHKDSIDKYVEFVKMCAKIISSIINENGRFHNCNPSNNKLGLAL